MLQVSADRPDGLDRQMVERTSIAGWAPSGAGANAAFWGVSKGPSVLGNEPQEGKRPVVCRDEQPRHDPPTQESHDLTNDYLRRTLSLKSLD